jgi:hypothetical protein
MPELRNRLDQHPSRLAAALTAAIQAQRDHAVHDQVAADARRVESTRTGGAEDAPDPATRSLARWRALMAEET